MLTIRPEQYEVFAAVSRERFVQRMREFLKQKWKAYVTGMSDAALDTTIRKRWSIASSQGMVTERATADFIVVTFMLGEQFYQKPEFPWARVILGDRQRQDVVKAQQLQYNAEQHLKRQKGAV